jgi:tetratricopeptide (TPR) repeat protein
MLTRPHSLLIAVALCAGGSAAAAPPLVKWSSDAARAAPSLLQVIDRRHRQIRTVRLRVYADPEYRASGTRWQERARGMVDDINQLTGPTYGVLFEIESLRRWDGPGRGASAGQALAALETLDPGSDVDWVVGFIAPLPLLTSSVHEIGMARELGQHFVLRAMADLEEARALDNLRLGNAEKEKLYSVRKWHKEISVFLHEWGHTLGGVHSREEWNIMNPTYSHLVAAFSGEEMAAIDRGLACRLGQPAVPASRCQPLLEYLQRTRSREWFTQDQESTVRLLRDNLEGNRSGPPTEGASTGGPQLSGDEVRTWNTALERLKEAHEQDQAGDRAAAFAAVNRAVEVARSLPAAGAPIWLSIAGAYLALGAITRGQEALARAGAGADVETTRAEIQRFARFYGLPAPASVPADAEPAYVRVIATLLEAPGGPALADVTAALATYPRAPGLLMVQCEARLRDGKRREAEKACTTALDAAPELARAHYLLGLLESDRGRRVEAVLHLRRSIDLDPEQRSPWQALGTVYRLGGKRKEWREIGEEYQKRFGAKLP